MSGVSLGYYYGLEFVKGDFAQLDHSYTRPFQSLVHHNKSEKVKPRVLLKPESEPADEEEVRVLCLVPPASAQLFCSGGA